MALVTTTLQVMGSTILALNMPDSYIGYWIMLLGCYFGMRVAASQTMKSWEFFVMWGFFFVVNLIGIYRWTPWN